MAKPCNPLLVHQQRSFVVQSEDAVERDLPDLQTVGLPHRSRSSQLLIVRGSDVVVKCDRPHEILDSACILV